MKFVVLFAVSLLISTSTARNRKGSSFSQCVCGGPERCPPADEYMQIFTAEPEACRQRLTETCSFADATDLTVIAYCMAGARINYQECPPYPEPIQPRMQRCGSCVRQCGGRQRPRRPIACHAQCSLLRACPTIIQIFFTVRKLPYACKSCIKNECELLKSNSKVEKALCMFRARARCESCYMSHAALRLRKACQKCMGRCEANTESRPGDSDRGFGKNIGNSTNSNLTNSTIGSSQESTVMQEQITMSRTDEMTPPTTQAENVQVEASQEGGRESARQVPGTELPINGYGDGNGDGYGDTRKADPGNVIIENEMRFRPPFRGAESPDPCDCFTTGRCPNKELVNRQLSTYSASCQKCISNFCANFSLDDNRNEFVNCIIQTRPNCNDCPPLGGRILTCRPCLTRCADKGGNTVTPRPSPAFRAVRNERNCRIACTGAITCPSANAILRAFGRFRESCRNCAERVCGGIDRRNRQDFADCAFQARLSCDECDLSERALAQRERCNNCIKECAIEGIEGGDEGGAVIVDPGPSPNHVQPDSNGGSEDMTPAPVVVVG